MRVFLRAISCLPVDISILSDYTVHSKMIENSKASCIEFSSQNLFKFENREF